MAKTVSRIDLSDPKGSELFFIGISSGTGAAILCQQLNKYLGIKLSFYSTLMALNQNTILDSLPIFTNFEPVQNKMDFNNLLKNEDVFDLTFQSKEEISKFLLIQCKGEHSTLFPKIVQLDFLFISNYSLENLVSVIQSIPEITVTFGLHRTHIGKRIDYFQKLFYTS